MSSRAAAGVERKEEWIIVTKAKWQTGSGSRWIVTDHHQLTTVMLCNIISLEHELKFSLDEDSRVSYQPFGSHREDEVVHPAGWWKPPDPQEPHWTSCLWLFPPSVHA